VYYLATALSLVPQFLHGANTPQYRAVTNYKKDLILNLDTVAWWMVNKTVK
jgi:hypothetical protein